MARALYTLLWWLALPVIPLRLWWRSRREPGYREHVAERFGRFGAPAEARETWWVHAVSVGETRAAAPLIERLAREHPDARIVLTCMTATGRETGRTLYGDRVLQAFLPYDLPFAIDGFLAHYHPRAGLVMETELWPNLVARCRAHDVPLFLANARMSARSAAGYARVPAITGPMLAALTGIAAQTTEDAQRLAALGGRDIVVTGNLKFDVEVTDQQRARGRDLRRQFGDERPVWIAASTREGEEDLLLAALLRNPLPAGVLTVIVPRHPQRFAAVADLLRARGLAFVRRSEDRPVPADVRFVLGDSMGEMAAYYAACDVAFVGGSLLPLGGQNLIEPIALGCPTLTGPHTFNFADAAERAVAQGAARRVVDADALVATVRALLAAPAERAEMADAAARFHAAHRGAIDRTWAYIGPRLPRGTGAASPSDAG
jgi:3-deoxy-D-manno-octulosonic-acid transferase